MTKQVQIYTTNSCAYCPMVKQYLQQKGVDYEEVNLEVDPARRQEMFELTGQMAVPVTVVTSDNDQKHVTVGFNIAKLASSLAA